MLKPYLIWIVNAAFFLFLLIVILYLNTFINSSFIPNALQSSFGVEMLTRWLIASIEGLLLILMYAYLVNKRKAVLSVLAFMFLFVNSIIFFAIYFHDK